jgi:hypothetical protein
MIARLAQAMAETSRAARIAAVEQLMEILGLAIEDFLPAAPCPPALRSRPVQAGKLPAAGGL